MSCSYGSRFGSNCSFTCRNGYSIRGSVQRQCEAEDGKPPAHWTGNETHCESKTEVTLYFVDINQTINQLTS